MVIESNIEHEHDSSPSSHTIQLTKAFQDCSDGIERLRQARTDCCRAPLFNDTISASIHSAWVAAERYHDERKDGINHVRRRLDTFNRRDTSPIDVIHVNHDGLLSLETTSENDTFIHNGNEATQMKPRQFKQMYCTRNVPCIIRGLNETAFSCISSNWRSQNNNINVEWFRRFVGDSTKVPVRFDCHKLSNNTINEKRANGLDSDGRATECETIEMTLREWIEYCLQNKQQSQKDRSKAQERKQIELASAGYLKDWHLLQILVNKQNVQYQKHPLYSVPSIFERDLLNNFLTRYTSGDYKFVYWGPRESRTNLHSDVLHSFSWSYNVIGKKRWTFYIPEDDGEGSTRDAKTFELVQDTGETIFVPSKWKHEVVNLVETLSINHNWITSSNIDLTYECLLTEIASIEKEIKEWGVVSDDDYEARENMLRGCVGLDISMLILMVLLELIELLGVIFSVRESPRLTQSNVLDEDSLWDYLYSIFRLRSVLEDILFTDSAAHGNVNAVQRLAATLDSGAMASAITSHAEFCIDLSKMLQKCQL